jgi:hypothetical protein
MMDSLDSSKHAGSSREQCEEGGLWLYPCDEFTNYDKPVETDEEDDDSDRAE